MFANRITHQTLSTLCERVGVAFDVGLDPHRIFLRESERPGTTYRRHMKSVAEHVSKGSSLADAVKAQGNYFPSHFADMIDGGEKTGRLERVLTRLSEYYQQLADFRSLFLSSILWPLIQLIMAVIIVGLLILLPAVILGDSKDANLDLLGLGLVGWPGLRTYAIYVAIAIAFLVAFMLLLQNGYFSFLADWAARLPIVGRIFSVFPEARFVQTLSLAIDSGIDAWTAVDLAFRSAGTPQFTRRAEPAKEAILQGKEIHRVLADTGLFQNETIEAVELGEDSGRLAETLEKHFRHLRSQTKTSMATITYTTSAIVWFVTAAAIVFIIFRIFSLYVNNIADAASAIAGGS